MNITGMNPYKHTLKKYVYEMIQDKYDQDIDYCLDRICQNIITEKDYKDFGKLIVGIYEAGFFKSLNSYKEQMKKAGFDLIVKRDLEEQPKNTIFKNQ